MAQYYSNELAGDTTGLNTAPAASIRPAAGVYGGKYKVFRATITFASQASGSTFVLGKIPAGHVFSCVQIGTDTSTGSATIAVGNAGSSTYYAAASAYTTTNTLTLSANIAAMKAGAYTAEETIIATTGGAALPASGTMVIELYFDAA